MNILRINGGRALSGSVRVHGSKNSVLPIMAASIIKSGDCVIKNCPNLSDVEAASKILTHLGCQVSREKDQVYINSATMDRFDVPDALMREMRSSVIFLGAILARAGEAVLSLPGGCELGPRPIDIHLNALRLLGAEIEEKNGNIVCKGKSLAGARINLSIPSVGATENAMLAACQAAGTTVITNAAREPEIEDLQEFLTALGAKVAGGGSSTITIEGISGGGSAEYSIIPDRIVAATYLSAAAAAGGSVELTGTRYRHLQSVIDALREAGCDIETAPSSIRLTNKKGLKAIRPVITQPYPGFPTDAQPPLMAAMLQAEGTTVFVENIFENRYRHVSELLRMGADIKLEGKTAIVCGGKRLHGAPVKSTDLRGGAALVVAALAAEGQTEVSALSHIDRGYESIENSLRVLGADIVRV